MWISHFRLLLFFGVVTLLNGCRIGRPQEDPTRFYVLTVPGRTTESLAHDEVQRFRIGLKPVEVPVYLQSKSMVVRTGTNEIEFAEFDRWAEPLDQGVSRVLKEVLSEARNVGSVTLNSHGGEGLDFEVAIRISACEGVRGEKGSSFVRFAASWEIRPVGANSLSKRRGGFIADRVTWDGKSYARLAERLSGAVANASIALAADLPVDAGLPPKVRPNTRP